jgi:hypothetical protein
VKYTVDNVPARGASAFMPVLNACVSARAPQWGMVRITGHPGDLAVPSARPQLPTTGALVRTAQPSSNSPDVFYPSIYYTQIGNFHPAGNTVRIISTNEVPIPARRFNLVAKIAQRAPRVGGARQVTWPPAPQAWQNIAVGGSGG